MIQDLTLLPSEVVRAGWCQRHHAIDKYGDAVSVLDPRAMKWDLLGAIIKAQSTGTKLPHAIARVLVETSTGSESSLSRWNDRAGRTQAEVVFMLQQAGL